MTSLVETKNASLSTLSVTIQALHVSGKQMTLAVFRQLPVAEAPDGAALWGTVRYSIKDEGSLWLVFSHDGRLYRQKLSDWPQENAERSVRQTAKAFQDGQASRYTDEKSLARLERECQDAQDQLAMVIADKATAESVPQLFIAV